MAAATVTFPHIAIWLICAGSIAGVIARPRGIPEWIWASAGAAFLIVFGLVPIGEAAIAIGRGSDVYFFLAGMMLLAELARRESVFDWIAAHAVRASHGSPMRLFVLVYGVGIGVTAVLSNDATAVVLTPAVAAAVRRTGVAQLPYLYACAFIANAASFILPISNPANFVIFARAMPALPQWFAAFGVPSLVAIGATFCALAWFSRKELRGTLQSDVDAPPLTAGGRIAIGGIALTATALIMASAFGAPLGVTTAACGAVVFAVAALRDSTLLGPVLRSVSWPVLALVAGLFVLVQGLERTGLLFATRHLVETMAAWSPVTSVIGAAFVTAIASNLINNLPSGLIAGSSVAALHGHDALRSAIAIGIDLGPNLSVTGSLATVLWLIALRREQIDIDAWSFLRAGAIVMPPALILSVLSVLLTTR